MIDRFNKRYTNNAKVLDESSGLVEAFVNSMGIIDSDGDVISPQAFDRSIQSNLPIPVLNHHDQSQIVGKVISANAVPFNDGEYRLKAVMQMNLDTESGRDAFSNVKGQFSREWSVGFNGVKDGSRMEREGDSVVRLIDDLDWVETSMVVRGASPNTTTISAKEEKEAPQIVIEETTASDTDNAASDTDQSLLDEIEMAKARIAIEKGWLDLKMPKKKPKKKY